MQEHILDSIDPRQLGRRLQEMRKARGITQQDVAEHLGVARTTITAIEKGERRVQPGELIRMAQLYGRAVSELVGRPEPSEDFAVQFRTKELLQAVERSEAQPSALHQAVTEFRSLCQDYLYLERLSKSPMRRTYLEQYPIEGISPDEAGQDVATAERNRLGLGEGPVLNLREVLESDVGLRIFFIEMPSRVAGMFGYTEELGGCITVNVLHPEERRRWTLAHEYGHFLTSRLRPEISVLAAYDRKPATERFADAFAGNLLMPFIGLQRRANEIRRARQSLSAADLCALAHYYFVSVEAMALRMENLRLLPPGTWYRLQGRGFKVREAQQFLGLAPHPQADHALPLRYRYLAAEAFQKGKLTEGELARLLRSDRLGARKLVQELSHQRYLSTEGDLTALSVDLAQPLGTGESGEEQ